MTQCGEIKNIESFQYNLNFTAEENHFDFIGQLLELDEKTKKINYSLYDYSAKVKQVLFDCIQLHNERKNHLWMMIIEKTQI